MNEQSDRKAATAHSFGDNADGYRVSEMHREGRDLEILADWCRGSTRVLDVATGAGHTAGALIGAGTSTVIAADASPSMVATAVESFPAAIGVVTDAERLPFGDETFDAVTCRIAAHHFPDPEAFVGEVARVLRPGGTFALEDNVAPEDDALDSFVNDLERRRDPTHVRSYKTSTWNRYLSEAGFDIKETDHLMKTLQYQPWVQRISTLDGADREAIHRLLWDADDDVVEFFNVSYQDGEVVSFGSLKGLFCGVRR